MALDYPGVLAAIELLAERHPEGLSASGKAAAADRAAERRDREAQMTAMVLAGSKRQMENFAQREALRNGTVVDPVEPRPGLDPRRFNGLSG